MSTPMARVALLVVPVLLAGCVVIGPTVAVTPGTGRPPAVFADDRRACMAATDQQVQPIANRSVAASLAGRQGAQAGVVTTAELQRLYDARYGQCMAARGNTVIAVASGAGASSGSQAADLTDADSMSARQAVQGDVTNFQKACPGERIVVTVSDAPLASSVKARVVSLSTPDGGLCFGQPGQNAYLVAKQGAGWSRLLSAEPGSIELLPGRHTGYRDVQMNSLGLCTYQYAWNGRSYAQIGSKQCGTAAPPTLGTLSRAIRSGPSAINSGPATCPATNAYGRPLSRSGTGTLFDGNPSELVALAPTGTTTGPNGSYSNTWQLPAIGRPYILACHYAGAADVLLPLGPAARRCQQDRTSFVCR